MAKFRVETQLAIDKASAAGAKVAMEGVTKAATQLAAVIGGGKAFIAPFKAFKSVIEDSIAASEKATAAQERMGEAIKNVYKTIGDEMTPGLNQLAESIQKALANPDIIQGLQTTGQLLSVMATGVSAVVDEIAGFVGSPAFAKWLQFFYGVDLDTDAMKAYREQGKLVDDITAAVSKWAKGVGEQQKAEEKAAEARKKAHAEHLRALEAILDKVNPVAKAERETWKEILTLNQAMRAGEIDVTTYQDALGYLSAELRKVQEAAQLTAYTIQEMELPDRLDIPDIEPPRTGGSMTVEAIDTAASLYNDAFEEANQQLSANLQAGLTGAFTSALVEFAHGGEDAFKHFGDAMLDVLLNAVAEWLAAQLAAIAKAAIASKAIGGGSGGGAGGVGSMGGMGGMSSGAGTALAVVAVMAALVAVLKHQTDRANAVRYDTAAGVRYNNGSTVASHFGKLDETGQKVEDALAGLLQAFQGATGSFIEGIVTAEVTIRNDKTQFRAIVNGIMIGQFKTAEEAIIAAAKGAFLSSDLSKALDPIIRQMIEGYQGKDPQELFTAIDSVQKIIDEVSGLTDIEVALRNLPQQAAALSNQLTGMGVAFDDAQRLASDWQISQMNNLRDQITGHQKTAAEEMAERQRQALMFNAQVELMRAEITLKRTELAARVAALEAGGKVLEADLTLKNAELNYQKDFLLRKVEVFEQDINVHEWYLTTIGTIGNTSLEILQTMIAALDAQLANLPELILPGQIRVGRPGGGHGGGNIQTGPTPEEIAAQLAADIATFWEGIAASWRSAMGGVSSQLLELNYWYEEQAARARELGIPLEELNALYEQQLLNLQNDTLASLNLQSVATAQQFANLREALKYLKDWGAITEAQLRELGDTMYISLVDSLLQYVDNEDVRRQLEDLRFRMEMANYELQFQMLLSLGILTQAEIDIINGLFAGIFDAYENGTLDFQIPDRPDNLPDAGAGSGSGSGGGNTQHNGNNWRDSAEDALRQALDRLRNAIDGLREFQEGMLLSSASPLTISQQYEEAARQYAELLAAAQGGDIGAMEQLAGAAQTYLDLAGQMFGTAGSGYGAIFEAVSQQIAAIVAAGQGVLDGAPPQMQGTEQRLDTIAEILNQMRLLYGGAPTWHPPTGQLPPGSAAAAPPSATSAATPASSPCARPRSPPSSAPSAQPRRSPPPRPRPTA